MSIEKILDFYITEDGTPYYQVKWKPTWERADALSQFSELIDEFWKHINAASTGNALNNKSMIEKPKPDILKRPPPVVQQQQQYNISHASPLQPVQAPTTPTHRGNSFGLPQNSPAHTPRRRASSTSTQSTTPQRRPSSVSSEFAQQHNTASSPHTSAPSMVIIDSDEEDDVVQVHPPSNNNLNQPVPDNMQHYSGGVKVENLDQKPILQHPQQQQMGNLPQNNFIQRNSPSSQPQFVSPSSRGRGGVGRGRGVGMSPAKRKLGMPPVTSPKNMKQKQMGSSFGFSNNAMKTEQLSAAEPASPLHGKWEDNFEIIEKKNFDGTQLEVQYQCKVCGTIVGHKSSCYRHFKKHSGDKDHLCPICKKPFYRLDYLQRHLKTHGNSGNPEELESLIKLAMVGVKK